MAYGSVVASDVLASIAYNAYRLSFIGSDLPIWQQLTQDEKKGWIKAVEATKKALES